MAQNIADQIHQNALRVAQVHQTAKNAGRPISMADAKKRVGQVADFRTLNSQVKQELAAKERLLAVAHTAMKQQLRRFGGKRGGGKNRGFARAIGNVAPGPAAD